MKTGLLQSLASPKLHPKHRAFDIVANANEEVTGVRGQPIIIEDIEGFVVLKADIEEPEPLINLIANKRAMLINDGKGIKWNQ